MNFVESVKLVSENRLSHIENNIQYFFTSVTPKSRPEMANLVFSGKDKLVLLIYDNYP